VRQGEEEDFGAGASLKRGTGRMGLLFHSFLYILLFLFPCLIKSSNSPGIDVSSIRLSVSMHPESGKILLVV
jgi:hypothetical protein